MVCHGRLAAARAFHRVDALRTGASALRAEPQNFGFASGGAGFVCRDDLENLFHRPGRAGAGLQDLRVRGARSADPRRRRHLFALRNAEKSEE